MTKNVVANKHLAYGSDCVAQKKMARRQKKSAWPGVVAWRCIYMRETATGGKQWRVMAATYRIVE